MIPPCPPNLLAIPVQLVNHKRTGDSHASCGAATTLELIDVLVHNLEKLLVEVVVVVRVLKEEGEDWAPRVEVVIALVD